MTFHPSNNSANITKQKETDMKKLNIVLLLILLSYQYVFCQQDKQKNEEEIFLQQIESSPVIPPSANELIISNSAQIQQIGNYNNASITQTLTGLNIQGNIAELIQHGDINNAVLTQTGYGNYHSINQNGDGNTFAGIITGNNNSSIIEQAGNDNSINQNLLGNNMAFILSQYGNNNEIMQVENDQQSRQYQIIQTGNDMKILIINGSGLP